ncbi:hypothetical protein [Pragia fontium]|uniref:hypothetical protein n=1 Tax=Pragia fontium TaxID=82985 RepID=UPI000F6F9829|nr:hypothetical protein [Pragia fontium]VEJ56208.1 Uncharacterised protein [Pragia fontium]
MRDNIRLIVFTLFFSFVFSAYAEKKTCSINSCDGLTIQKKIRDLINSDGYENIAIDTILNKRYLVIAVNNEVNKCSVLFPISGNKISDEPILLNNAEICNYNTLNNKVISRWRDSGKWYEDVYQVNDTHWKLVIRDECVGCDIVKRKIYLKNNSIETALLSDGINFLGRKKISGIISVQKAKLFKSANSGDISKAYLIKGDIFDLIDISNDGRFYKIKYLMKNGKSLTLWVNVDDFSIYH